MEKNGNGPTSQLYLTSGDNGTIFTVQGQSVTSASEVNNEYAIAVSSDVRTLGYYSDGSGYTLTLVPIGRTQRSFLLLLPLTWE